MIIHKKIIYKRKGRMILLNEKRNEIKQTSKTTSNKGITLIALVITIIVLLILATVTITSLVGENGIIKQAIKAAELTDQKTQEEEKQIEDLEKLLTDSTGDDYPKVDDSTPGDITDGGKQDGTPEKPYKIQSVEDLVAFIQEANKPANDAYAGKTITLENNLDIASEKSYVNSKDTSFGDLNGDGQVKGLLEELTDKSALGLPRIKEFSGTIKGNSNSIKNYYRKIEENIDDNAFIGKLKEEGKVYDFSLQGEIKFKLNSVYNPWIIVGGIVGRNVGEIKNCHSNVDVNVEVKDATTNGSYILLVGTIAGSNGGMINSCVNYGNVNVDYEENIKDKGVSIDLQIGGISGFLNGNVSKNTIVNTINYGNITANVNSIGSQKGNDIRVGGIAGDIDNNSVVENIANSGNITIVSNKGVDVGGAIGYTRERASDLNVENIVNKGNIQATSNISSSTGKADLELGGIIGDAYGSPISKLFSLGSITDKSTAKTDFYGAIVGDKHSNTFPDSYYLASIAPYGVEAGSSSAELEGITRVDQLTISDVVRYMNANVMNHNENANSNAWKKWKVDNSQNIIFE